MQNTLKICMIRKIKIIYTLKLFNVGTNYLFPYYYYCYYFLIYFRQKVRAYINRYLQSNNPFLRTRKIKTKYNQSAILVSLLCGTVLDLQIAYIGYD
jgi:hypothetical protein